MLCFIQNLLSFTRSNYSKTKTKLEVGIGQKFVNRLIGHFFSTINRLIVENMLHNGNNKIY